MINYDIFTYSQLVQLDPVYMQNPQTDTQLNLFDSCVCELCSHISNYVSIYNNSNNFVYLDKAFDTAI